MDSLLISLCCIVTILLLPEPLFHWIQILKSLCSAKHTVEVFFLLGVYFLSQWICLQWSVNLTIQLSLWPVVNWHSSLTCYSVGLVMNIKPIRLLLYPAGPKNITWASSGTGISTSGACRRDHWLSPEDPWLCHKDKPTASFPKNPFIISRFRPTRPKSCCAYPHELY